MRRSFEILGALGGFALKLGIDQKQGNLEKNMKKRAGQLRRIFTRLGPTFVKLGQGLSTRPDLCPPDYLEELAELQVLLFPLSFTQLYVYEINNLLFEIGKRTSLTLSIMCFECPSRMLCQHSLMQRHLLALRES